ncbi:MAG: AAA family ATPase, partial [Clostridiales bacterium]
PNLEDIEKLRSEFFINDILSNDSIIKVEEIVEEKEKYFLVLEHFEGELLSNYIKKRILNLKQFLMMAIKIVDALGVIHKSNVIHKDINPNNIVFNSEICEIKITGFDISSLFTEYENIEKLNKIEGTLPYISPEQTGRLNMRIDYRTDYYSLGIVFFEMLTGILPYKFVDELELINCHLAKKPIKLTETREDIPSILEKIIFKLMEKNPEDRYQSIYGLKNDLEKCILDLSQTGKIEDFIIGTKDISNVFLISQHLYGRESEKNRLKSAFSNTIGKKGNLIVVSGSTGIGKSVLVNEIKKMVVENEGYFISGKYEQNKNNEPYFAIVNSFNSLINQVLLENEEHINLWKKKISNSIGKNASIIVEMIPKLELLIGKQNTFFEVSVSEAQNRFNNTYKKFINACATEKNPLVIFLDDVQWSDSSSLKLIDTVLQDNKIKNILFIVSYRDDEVDEQHENYELINKLVNSDYVSEKINLEKLNLNDIKEFVKDMMQLSNEDTEILAKISFNKTKGNPFFIKQFFKSIYKNNLIWFDKDSMKWNFDKNSIISHYETENVIQLMEKRIEKLSIKTKKVLEVASCIGTQFSFKILLKLISNRKEITLSLLEAVNEEVIIPLGDSYNYLYDNNYQFVKDLEFKFFHDRIQNMVYNLFNFNKKEDLHKMIGDIILKEYDSIETGIKIFDVINHFNIYNEKLRIKTDRLKLAQLYLLAGSKAKETIAYSNAYECFEKGIENLENTDWGRYYNLTFRLYFNSLEASYLISKFENLENRTKILLENANNLNDKAKVYEISILAFNMQGNIEKALKTASKAMKLFGVNLSINPNAITVFKEFLSAGLAIKLKGMNNIINVPEMKNEKRIALFNIFGSILAAAYLSKTDLFMLISFRVVKYSLKYGNNMTYSGVGYVCYAAFLCGVLENIELGSRMGEIALDVSEKLKSPMVKVRTKSLYYIFVNHWKNNIRISFKYLMENYEEALECGDFEYASYCLVYYVRHSFFAGSKIDKLKKKCNEYVINCEEMGQIPSSDILNIYLQMIGILTKNRNYLINENDTIINADYFEEKEKLDEFDKTLYKQGTFSFCLCKMILCLHFDDLKNIDNYMDKAEKTKEAAISLPIMADYYFYSSIIKCELYTRKENTFKLKKDILKGIKKLKKWSKYAPSNFINKYYIVLAEWYKIKGIYQKACDYYEMGIKYSKENKFIHQEALAKELAAKFYFKNIKDNIAEVYLKEAYYCYLEWGAYGKLDFLKDKYHKVFIESISRKESLLSKNNAFVMSKESFNLDLVNKSIKTLSGIKNEKDMLRKFIKIVLENAGAQKAFLILRVKDKLYLRAEGNVENKKINLYNVEKKLDDNNELPVNILNYVNRTKDVIVFRNACLESNDNYFLENKIKSIVCLPMFNDKFIGMLYLENNRLVGAFAEETVNILKTLATHLAISLENYIMYNDMKFLIEQKTQELLLTKEKYNKIKNQSIESDETKKPKK